MADETDLKIRRIDIAWEMTKSSLAGFIAGDPGTQKSRISQTFKEMYDAIAETIGEPNPPREGQ